jgi:hypothetical protein
VSAGQGGAKPATAHGLRSGSASRFVTYLRFRIPSSAGSVVTSSLRVSVESTTQGGFLVVGTEPAPFAGSRLEAGHLPRLAAALGTSGPTVRGRSSSVALRGLRVGASHLVTLALVSASGADLSFGGTAKARPPRLSVTYRVGGSASEPADAKAVPPVQIAAAGDIACDADKPRPSGQHVVPGLACAQRETSDLLLALGPDAVLPLGDTQYSNGAFDKYGASYAPTWGRLLPITHPVTGNHEYFKTASSSQGAGYFAYFGATAGAVGRGWYSFDLGGWHLVALNAQCEAVGGCQAGSEQERWLSADLAAHPAACTLAYWHQPKFSSGQHGDDHAYDAFWKDLYSAGAELVLNAHDHDYERFAPQTPAGRADPSRGIREFVVGTGGEDQRPFGSSVRPNSEVREDHSFGVLSLELKADSYSWRFVAVPGSRFTDTGRGTCHGRP